MTGLPTLAAELSRSLSSLWTRYAGQRPTGARTVIRGNVVTCSLADAVGSFNETIGDTGRLTLTSYKREAVAAVARVTHQRVASFISSHDRDTDVATEVFTLEPSLVRGARPTDRRIRRK